MINVENTGMEWWNTVGLPWTEEYYTINEIGYLYIVQGDDLNYFGVVLAPQ